MEQKRKVLYPYRIQVRLDGAARDALDRYRVEKGDLTLSEAVRRLIGSAPIAPVMASGGSGRRGNLSIGTAAPFHPRPRMKAGRRPGSGFIQFFARPSDIGVPLDQALWNRLCTYALRQQMSVSEAVRALCCGTSRVVAASAGRRLSGRVGEDLDETRRWDD